MTACCLSPVSSRSKKYLGNHAVAVSICTEDTEEVDFAVHTVPRSCSSLYWQAYSRPSSLISSSPQRSMSSDADGERQLNLNGSSAPTATQALMTMYRRRSPGEFDPKLVGASAPA